jgi:hypothetical protein
MVTSARRTQEGYASDLAAFLNFLWLARGQRSWRDADEADHLAYLQRRRRDCDGPQVAGSTWNREVAAVNQFYRWAVRDGHVQASPNLRSAGGPGRRRLAGRAGGTWISSGLRRMPMMRSAIVSTGCRQATSARLERCQHGRL